MTDLLLRQVQASRAGAQGDDDYDVIGSRGLVIGRSEWRLCSLGTDLDTARRADSRRHADESGNQERAPPLDITSA
jgi:hypothetical protein